MPFVVVILIGGPDAVLLRLGALSASFALAKLGLIALGLILFGLLAWLFLTRRRRP